MAAGVFLLFEGINLLRDFFKNIMDELWKFVGFWLFVLKKDDDESEYKSC